MLNLLNSDKSQIADKYNAVTRSQAVIEFAPDGKILTANQNFLDAMGYTLEEIVGQNHALFVENDYAASPEYPKFWDTLRAGQFQAAEYKRIGKGGRPVWIQGSYNPVRDASGRTYRVVKFATDVTERKPWRTDGHAFIGKMARRFFTAYGISDGRSKRAQLHRHATQRARSHPLMPPIARAADVRALVCTACGAQSLAGCHRRATTRRCGTWCMAMTTTRRTST